jgi:hypothetical protein
MPRRFPSFFCCSVCPIPTHEWELEDSLKKILLVIPIPFVCYHPVWSQRRFAFAGGSYPPRFVLPQQENSPSDRLLVAHPFVNPFLISWRFLVFLLFRGLGF